MDVQRESRVGAMMTYGNPASGDDNGLVGIDYRYRNSNLFGSQVFVADAYFMKSFSEDINNNELAYGLTLDFPNDRWNAQVRYKEIQENFNPALGFVNRSGIRQYDADLRYRIRPENNRLFRPLTGALSLLSRQQRIMNWKVPMCGFALLTWKIIAEMYINCLAIGSMKDCLRPLKSSLALLFPRVHTIFIVYGRS